MSAAGTIVVGYDASPESDVALAWAAARAEMTGASLHLVRAVQSDLVIDVLGTDKEVAPAKLPKVEEIKDQLGQDRVTLVQSVGSPSEALVKASEDAELVVIGTRGRNTVVAGLIGSTAYAVTAHAHSPVVVVRTGDDQETAPVPGPDAPVVIGVESAESSKASLDTAARLAAEYDAPLRLVRATDVVPVAAMTAAAAVASVELISSLEQGDEETLAECAAYVKQQHPDLTLELVRGSGEPSRVLMENTDNAGIIVVGSRGLGGFRGLLLGSVSHAVIHGATCPVLVLRSALG